MNEQNTQRFRVIGLETFENELHGRVFLGINSQSTLSFSAKETQKLLAVWAYHV